MPKEIEAKLLTGFEFLRHPDNPALRPGGGQELVTFAGIGAKILCEFVRHVHKVVGIRRCGLLPRDNVTKPFGMEELLARMRTALRHQLHVQGEPPLSRLAICRSIWCGASSRSAARS